MTKLISWYVAKNKLNKETVQAIISLVPASTARKFELTTPSKKFEYAWKTFDIDLLSDILGEQMSQCITTYDVEDLTLLKFGYNNKAIQGSLPKAYNQHTFYKMSYISGNEVVGHESLNECIANVLCQQFGFDYVSYNLHYAKTLVNKNEYVSFIVSAPDYELDGEKCITLENWLRTNTDLKSDDRYEVFQELQKAPVHVLESIYHMCVIDYVIINRDRHGANIELLCTNNNLRLAPIFDCGSSFVAPLQNDVEKVKAFDPLKERPCNNYVGSPFLEEAIKYWGNRFPIRHIVWKPELIEVYRDYYPDPVYVDKINEIITKRLERLYAIRGNLT